MDIRTFRESDESDVIALWTQVFGYSASHNNPILSIRNKLAFQPELFFVALKDAKVVGTVMAGYDGHRGWIYSLAVLPGYRRCGLARALMQHAEKALKEKGAPKINLQLLASNIGTTEF